MVCMTLHKFLPLSNTGQVHRLLTVLTVSINDHCFFSLFCFVVAFAAFDVQIWAVYLLDYMCIILSVLPCVIFVDYDLRNR